MEEVENFFNDGYAFLKSRMSFIFSDNSEKAVSQRASWSVGYWSKLIKPSHVEKYGTNIDKLLLHREREYFGQTASNAVVAILKSILDVFAY